jgi:uncharacterized protein YbjT (DUF2867 family)
MDTVLVTGATGNVGAGVVRELAPRDVRVRALVRDAAVAASRLPGVAAVVGDFEDSASLQRAMDGVATVLVSSRNHPRQAEHEIAVIDAAARAGVRRIVKVSSIGAEPGSSLAFWDAHGRSERHLWGAGVPAVVLRPNFYMTNVFGAADTIRADGRIFAPAAGARIAMVDPRDVSAVAAITLTESGHEGRTYTLSGPAAIGYDDLAATLSWVTGDGVAFVDVPEAGARHGMVAAGMPEWFVDQMLTLFGKLREGAAAEVTGTVQDLTGHPPRSFEGFARDHARMFERPVAR